MELGAIEQIQLEGECRLADQRRFGTGQTAVRGSVEVALSELWLRRIVQLPKVIGQFGRRLFDERAEQQLIHFRQLSPARSQNVTPSRNRLVVRFLRNERQATIIRERQAITIRTHYLHASRPREIDTG